MKHPPAAANSYPMNGIAHIGEIMKGHGATCAPEEFHALVNVTFHKFESEVYDELHRDMWESLPEQFQLLVDDYLRKAPESRDSLRVLDVGCGTGLASDCLLKTELGRRIGSIDLLDTSPSMLYRASQRAKSWNRPFRCLEGLLGSVRGPTLYDIVVSCSVLHHIPDIPAFLRTMQSLQAQNGIFIHMQDPNGDFLADPELNARMKKADEELSPGTRRFTPRRVFSRLYREITGKQRKDYIVRTNRELLEKGIIKNRLSVPEIFSITDIHVHDGHGVSILQLRELLPDYELISRRSYGFMGRLAYSLPEQLKRIERREIAAHAPNGFHLGAVWMRRFNRID